MDDTIDQTGIAELVDWLSDGCPSASDGSAALNELCQRLTASGIALACGALYVRTLHPEIIGARFMWLPETGAEMSNATFEMMDDPELQASPIQWVIDSGARMRRRLGDPDCPMDFSMLDRFRADGITDFIVAPLRESRGKFHLCAWQTRAPGGFSEAAVATLQAIEKPLARVAEARSMERIAINLLDTYVGGQAGARILSGSIRRGNIEAIHAAIWLSDMRGFTARADRMPVADLVDLLNRYFDCQVPAILAHGGEVLKFMGDGLLAIFPIGDAATGAVCRNALAAARSVESTVAEADWGGLEAKGGLRFGVALHIGEVLYGNVGSSRRLDFTCIGPAVNVAARIEALSGQIGRTILASSDFAQHCPAEVENGALLPIGAFALKGVSAPQRVYGVN